MRVLKVSYPNGKLEVFYLPKKHKGIAEVDKVYLEWTIKGKKVCMLNLAPGEALDVAIGLTDAAHRALDDGHKLH
jgi:hypothetical protein